MSASQSSRESKAKGKKRLDRSDQGFGKRGWQRVCDVRQQQINLDFR